MTSLEFIARELLTTPKELTSRCKTRDLVRKRWTAMCFYRLMGLSVTRIGAILGLDHETVTYGLNKADEPLRAKAKEAYCKFRQEEPNCKFLPKRTKVVKVPNYQTGEIETKEIEI